MGAGQAPRKVKVAFFLPTLVVGGAEKSVLRLLRGFLDYCPEWQVELVVGHLVGEFVSHLPKDLKVVALNRPRLRHSLGALAKYLKQEKPDVMVSNLTPGNMLVLGANFLAGRPSKVVLVEHAKPSHELRSRGLVDRIVLQLMRIGYPLADRVVAVSKCVEDDIRDVIGQNRGAIHVAYNPVVEALPALEPTQGVRHNPYILAVGRLEAVKDFESLIRAYAGVHHLISERLVILGDGSLRAELESLAESLGVADQVEFGGFVHDPSQFYRDASLLVVSSQSESFGNTLVEAMAYGVPVVSTRCGGPQEILDEGTYGPLVSPGEPELLGQAVVATLKNPHPKESLRARAEKFSVRSSVESYGQLIHSLVPHPHKLPHQSL